MHGARSEFCSENSLKFPIKSIIDIVSHYRWLIDVYVSDVFVKDYVREFPEKWTETLQALEPPALATLLDRNSHDGRHVWPLSLLAYKASTCALSLPREPTDVSKLLDPDSKSSEAEDIPSRDGQLMSMDHCFRRHVKPKKQHEIKKLSAAINCLSQRLNCSKVVDVGSGQGHLSRLLSFGYGLDVTTVEAASCHIPKAKKFDREVIKDMQKSKHRQNSTVTGMIPPEPNHVSAWIEPDQSLEEFLSVISRSNTGENRANISSQNGGDKYDSVSCPESNCDKDTTCFNQTDKSFLIKDQNADNKIRSRAIKVSEVRCNDRTEVSIMGPLVSDEAGKQCVLKCECNNNIKDTADPSFRDNKMCNDHCNANGECACLRLRENGTENKVGAAGENVDSCCFEIKSKLISEVPNSDVAVKISGRQILNQINCENQKHVPLTPKLESKNSGDCDKTKVCDKFILTGLHACGDLTPTMLRVFCQCPQVAGLASVACCYMKLTDQSTPDADGKKLGYPMSELVRSLPGHELSYTAREMACHFADAYHQRLLDNPPELVLHSYRAALQEILMDIDPEVNHATIKLTIKKAHLLSFEKYAGVALQKLGLQHTLTKVQLERASKRIECWKDVVIVYTLRLMLAPVVESLILLDRMAYLNEHGIKCGLFPIFDPRLSPRNIVLLAYND